MQHRLRSSFKQRTILSVRIDCHASKLTRRAKTTKVICRVMKMGKTAYTSFTAPRGVHRVVRLGPSLIVLSFNAGRTRNHHCFSTRRLTRVSGLLRRLGGKYPRTMCLLAAPPKTCIHGNQQNTEMVGPHAGLIMGARLSCTTSQGLTV